MGSSGRSNQREEVREVTTAQGGAGRGGRGDGAKSEGREVARKEGGGRLWFRMEGRVERKQKVCARRRG